MGKWPIEITFVGWFTCDASFECEEQGTVYCPDFETIKELAQWVSENADY